MPSLNQLPPLLKVWKIKRKDGCYHQRCCYCLHDAKVL